MRALKQHGLMIGLLLGNAALYAAFLGLDLFFKSPPLSGILKFTAIALCFTLAAYTLLILRQSDHRRDALLLAGALFFTLISDAFLLLTDLHLLGVLCFCLAHLLYIRRYRPHAFLPFFLLYFLVLLLTALSGPLRLPLPPLMLASGFYGALIIFVTYCAFRLKRPRANAVLIRAGMVLFLLCDIHVMLFNILPPSGAMYQIASQLIWVFYLPSQTLLALSAFPFQGEER